MEATRVLIFSPYASRPQLTAYEGTIAKACVVRGATAQYLLCDGLLPECDIHWDSFEGEIAPRRFDLCANCKAGAIKRIAEFDVPYRWIGDFVSQQERSEAFEWAQSLSPASFLDANYRQNPVGRWVQSSVISYFRQYPVDLGIWRVASVYRGFVYSAAIVAAGLNNYLRANGADAALLFNGRQSITRVALEIFKQHGVRVLVHEYPFFLRDHIMLKPNVKCWNLEPFNEYWRTWKHVPLPRPALKETLAWLKGRRYGRRLSWHAFNKPHLGGDSIRKQLGLPLDRRLIALFTSSTDETAGDPDSQGPYATQEEWIRDVLEWIARRDDTDLVIRVHPNLAGRTGIGRAIDELKFYERLRSEAPVNVKVVLPDEEFNSYGLADEADVGLTFGSAIGLEMAMLGKPIVLAARAFYEEATQIHRICSTQELGEKLEASLGPHSSREIRREAFRLAYRYVFQFEPHFPLVSMVDIVEPRLNYSDANALAPGADSTLDRICGYLINDDALFDSPAATESLQTAADEDSFFDELDRSPDYLRNSHYDRWLPRLERLKRLGTTPKHVLSHLPFGAGPALARGSQVAWRSIMRWVERKA
jgi:hypothetical protein